MKRIGLTGGIASGKSTASAILRRFGAPIIDADAIAHRLMEPGGPLYEAYRAHFGAGVIRPDGQLDRRRIGRIAFADPAEKRWLDAAAHPVIRAAMQQELAEAEAAGVPVAVLDIPLRMVLVLLCRGGRLCPPHILVGRDPCVPPQDTCRTRRGTRAPPYTICD